MKSRYRLQASVLVLAVFAGGNALAAAQYGEHGAPMPMVEQLTLGKSASDYRAAQPQQKTLKLKKADDHQATSPKLSAVQKRRLRQPR